MNRRIQSVRFIDENSTRNRDGIRIKIGNQPSKLIYYYAGEVLRAHNITQFARRPFAGATRLEFGIGRDNTYGHKKVFKASLNGEDVDFCPTVTRKVLGLGQKTTKFSLWVK